MVEVNCATIRGDTAMSALFGHKKGAFTGAVSHRPGLLMQANGGLLFLDEIGELGIDEQTMLLRAIEEKRFLPVGSDREATSDFQLICGTNRDLPRAVGSGEFREDLLARINLWAFAMPGLAERRDDIEPNIVYELEQIAARTGRQFRFNKEAMQHFMRFAVSPNATWAANFRDLNAAISRMATMAPTGRITLEVVQAELERLQRAWGSTPTTSSDDALANVLSVEQLNEIDLFDRVQLAEVVRVCGQCKSLSEAGRVLFAASRVQRKQVNDADRLRKYLAKYDLTWSALE